ncbi:HAD-IG family 5'-nucleotidase [Hoyosella subflava]|uniref:HAD superfamily (Subfamily IG) hydrolase, 5'-nucleotidase n=1 Tax=Hoyosella subflava (strain DSM 45089 / JCM 17490 / NBRC 109087 / DQS3-9A1) TaxID=443218 RepID=F6EJU3_HOYSD|nr:HAD-IG family 5'-nucleotidase [Hoyosella subflava]AEF40118.1 HAD superfamily (Subfamily IG) hydrolase, 5'-nucleotidase [Hoyosella subflava DQS3-9A1]
MTEPARRVYANRTLNLRSVEAIGYDMDYTLLHYRTAEWEGAAFEHARRVLAKRGYPVQDLVFETDRYLQGLVLDLDLGNLVKATRFGYVIQAQHGTKKLNFNELRRTYNGVFIDLSEPRFRFLNTLFSISEAALYAQLVDLLDAGHIKGPVGYDELFKVVSSALDVSHTMGELKAEITADPDRFCDFDPAIAETLMDQRLAGKRLLLITNSEWTYTRAMMSYAFDRHVPSGNWRDLFDIVVVAAAKPRFFSESPPVFRVVDPERNLLEPHQGLMEPGGVYYGGCARLVEQSLELDGAQILYVGDHLFGDVHVSKSVLRWRTALIMSELEAEIADAARFADDEMQLRKLMVIKESLEDELSHARLARSRAAASAEPAREADATMSSLYDAIRELDQQIAPLAQAAGALGNPTWGPLMRAGNDKSLFARQVEKFADVYTSRVSNFGQHTPYAFLRATRTSLPHDVTAVGFTEHGEE